ncbi:hypothetical protein IHE49_03475 [Rhodanobacter sp. 7MK24]|uniref:hypothetical protein n=1 Tax=Rhodanobacter sp. 7MK24 TaxID=2775922 RepID=UPI0017826A7F|nr:hypothetical protein [Rhodanobacter sp. 7MK24]MBD8879537.1 hypothetical protein [Rhodanobacter sp. 7MK24]
MKLWISSLGLLSFALLSLPAWSADAVMPAPRGLSICAPDSQLSSAMKLVASKFGTLAGCFVSTEQAPIHGTNKPLESAFAIALFQSASGPYTVASVDQLYATTAQQWKNVKPLWDKDKSVYEQRVRKLMQEASSSASVQGSMSIDQPVLVSMRRIDPGSYTVVSIRRRKISKDGAVFSFDTADGDALILSDGNLTRLTIQRQLRGQSDVDAVRSEITDWVQEASKAFLAN